MHWYILGAGAIGRLWAWLFKQGAIPTTRILRDRSTLRRWRHGRGIALQESARVAFYSPAAEIIDSPAPIQLLVTTKAHDTLTALCAPYKIGCNRAARSSCCKTAWAAAGGGRPAARLPGLGGRHTAVPGPAAATDRGGGASDRRQFPLNAARCTLPAADRDRADNRLPLCSRLSLRHRHPGEHNPAATDQSSDNGKRTPA